MRILNIGGNFLVEALRRQGHQVVALGLQPECTVQLSHPVSAVWLTTRLSEMGFAPDACLMCDNGNLPVLIDVETLPYPSVFYSIDTFCNPWHPPYSYAFDMVLVAQREHVPLFPQLGAPPAWMPLFAPDLPPLAPVSTLPDAPRSLVQAYTEQRDIPVAFVGTLDPGNIPDRLPFLKAFRRIEPLFYKTGAYAPIFGRARIVLNQTAASELNFRCFEAMACGTALLTETSPHGLDELFVPGKNILPPYPRGDAVAAARIARDWLNQPEVLLQVASAGYQLVREQHCATHRAALVVRHLEGLRDCAAHQGRLYRLAERRHLLSTAYAILAEELAAPHLAPHRELYARLFSAPRA